MPRFQLSFKRSGNENYLTRYVKLNYTGRLNLTPFISLTMTYPSFDWFWTYEFWSRVKGDLILAFPPFFFTGNIILESQANLRNA